MAETTFIAVGDSFITRPIEDGYQGFEDIAQVIRQYDVKFTNLETTIHNRREYPAAVSGGTWACAEPAHFLDLTRYGFNLFSTANNHAFDYSYGGLLATIENVRSSGCVCAGTGCTLEEAAAPGFLTASNGTRIALLAASATCDASAIAGNANNSVSGRPGVNPLRYRLQYTVRKRQYNRLRKILDASDYFGRAKLAASRTPEKIHPDVCFPIGKDLIICGKENKASSKVAAKDMSRMTDNIQQARKSADYVLVSIHSHEYDGVNYDSPANFLKDFAHQCIDAGADVVIGHGPHELRGIEIYKDKPIFYSLGNFIFQNETVSFQPADAYEKRRLDKNSTVDQLMDARTNNGTVGLCTEKNVWQSVMAAFTAENGKITEITLYPVTLDMHLPRSERGWPRIAEDDCVLHHLQSLCRPFGTELVISDGIAKIHL